MSKTKTNYNDSPGNSNATSASCTAQQESSYLSPFYQTYPANGFTGIKASPEREIPPFALPHYVHQQPSFARSRRSSYESEGSNATSSRKSSLNTNTNASTADSLGSNSTTTQHNISDTNDADKKLQQRERNKQAASRFRIRQQYKTESLQMENDWLKRERVRLQRENLALKDENRRLSLEQEGHYEGGNMYTQRIF
ncbi:hypothetical protein E3P77_03765 [Wallemia ichthyophaga]|uniref:Basic leucine zipper transcriptional factor ATF-like n=1 Tax=Wallemia ichthyophaga TaxID=245174 RepID=A0A4T0JJK2_WALIC|nr:hypothetical protein E3P97_04028 [Wallemia ichthyophaga]TIA94850.1 hypothetical protein E3P95_04026 [Wallemia ichthyophaga]TIA95145.1 hypothetical protein E3P96_03907 [Wallemia ichthyophaga]TIA95534.1 hypothetical protein E3P94_04027 [Wallemia ichthyophaga]TIB07146.1 hypothetical protein E3P93_03991 [Wallemia ichthyophaga]